jgi:hypothetical protein
MIRTAEVIAFGVCVREACAPRSKHRNQVDSATKREKDVVASALVVHSFDHVIAGASEE